MVFDKKVDCVITDPAVPYFHDIDLRDYLQNKTLGQLFITVEEEPTEFIRLNPSHSQYRYRNVRTSWVQCTNLGISFFCSKDPAHGVYGCVSSLIDGSPVENASLSIGVEKVKTDKNGIAKFKNNSFTSATAEYKEDISFIPYIDHRPETFLDRRVLFSKLFLITIY